MGFWECNYLKDPSRDPGVKGILSRYFGAEVESLPNR